MSTKKRRPDAVARAEKALLTAAIGYIDGGYWQATNAWIGGSASFMDLTRAVTRLQSAREDAKDAGQGRR